LGRINCLSPYFLTYSHRITDLSGKGEFNHIFFKKYYDNRRELFYNLKENRKGIRAKILKKDIMARRGEILAQKKGGS
jgi:hypothetical protein